MTAFIDCSSLNISYNNMGIATISYSVVHNSEDFVTYTSINAGGQSFSGHIMNAGLNPIIGSDGWYETAVQLIATTN